MPTKEDSYLDGIKQAIIKLKALDNVHVVEKSNFTDTSLMHRGGSPDPQETPEQARNDWRYKNIHSEIDETGISDEELEKVPEEMVSRFLQDVVSKIFKI